MQLHPPPPPLDGRSAWQAMNIIQLIVYCSAILMRTATRAQYTVHADNYSISNLRKQPCHVVRRLDTILNLFLTGIIWVINCPCKVKIDCEYDLDPPSIRHNYTFVVIIWISLVVVVVVVVVGGGGGGGGVHDYLVVTRQGNKSSGTGTHALKCFEYGWMLTIGHVT